MLNFYSTYGMIVEKIHEIISFKQSKWLEKYNSFITQKRKRATNDFEKDFYKWLINAVFGKMIENVRSRLKIEFIKNMTIKKLLGNNQN